MTFPPKAANGLRVPRRAGENNALVLDVMVSEALGESTSVVGFRVPVGDLGASEFEYRDVMANGKKETPPFNLGGHQSHLVTVIAKFPDSLPAEGEVTIDALVPHHRDGRSTFALPPPVAP
jgi:hypothetical protein